MLLLALALTAAADPGHRPDVGDAVQVTLRPLDPEAVYGWRRGEAVVAVADGVLVRAEPDLDAPAIATLEAGRLLYLHAAPTKHAVDDLARPDRWLPVRVGEQVGWTRHAGLTAAAWETDLDGDGVPERVMAGFNGGAELVVRVRAGETTHVLNLGTRQDFEGVQDEAHIRILPASEAGIALVHANWSAREQCGSGDSSAYASFVARPGEAPALREALRHNGSGGDAPIWWDTTATFAPAEGTVAVVSRAGEDADDGSESVHHHTVERYTLEGGVFVSTGREVLVSE